MVVVVVVVAVVVVVVVLLLLLLLVLLVLVLVLLVLVLVLLLLRRRRVLGTRTGAKLLERLVRLLPVLPPSQVLPCSLLALRVPFLSQPPLLLLPLRPPVAMMTSRAFRFRPSGGISRARRASTSSAASAPTVREGARAA